MLTTHAVMAMQLLRETALAVLGVGATYIGTRWAGQKITEYNVRQSGVHFELNQVTPGDGILKVIAPKTPAPSMTELGGGAINTIRKIETSSVVDRVDVKDASKILVNPFSASISKLGKWFTTTLTDFMPQWLTLAIFAAICLTLCITLYIYRARLQSGMNTAKNRLKALPSLLCASYTNFFGRWCYWVTTLLGIATAIAAVSSQEVREMLESRTSRIAQLIIAFLLALLTIWTSPSQRRTMVDDEHVIESHLGSSTRS